MASINTTKEIDLTHQNVYDAFNYLMFSDNIKLLSKLLYKVKFLEWTRDVPGDILELGVFKGSGLLAWLKMKKIFSPNAFKKVIGFDMFDSNNLINSLSGHDKISMSNLFSDRQWIQSQDSYEDLKKKVYNAGFSDVDFELVKGDVSITTANYINNRPGAKISILYMDLDLEIPTYNSLCNLYDIVSTNGVIVFDEYGYHQWSESKGVDRFLNERKLKLQALECSAPTAFIRKHD